jgi:hypothetical protein
VGSYLQGITMTDMTPRKMLDAIHEGLEESALLTALGYDPTQGRPGRHLLNDVLEKCGFKRPIDEQPPERWMPYQPYPKEWIRDIVRGVTGRVDAPLVEAITKLKHALPEKPRFES